MSEGVTMPTQLPATRGKEDDGYLPVGQPPAHGGVVSLQLLGVVPSRLDHCLAILPTIHAAAYRVGRYNWPLWTRRNDLRYRKEA